MSLKAKQQPDSELDHIRHTLSDLVGLVGETRAEMHQRFDQHDKRFDNIEREQAETRKDIARLEQGQTETREDIARLELLIRQLLPNASN